MLVKLSVFRRTLGSCDGGCQAKHIMLKSCNGTVSMCDARNVAVFIMREERLIACCINGLGDLSEFVILVLKDCYSVYGGMNRLVESVVFVSGTFVKRVSDADEIAYFIKSIPTC